MTIRRGYSLIAINCGYKEDDIDNITYLFFKDLIQEIAIKLNYSSISHILANPYIEKSSEIVSDYNPFNVDTDSKKNNDSPKVTLGLLSKLGITSNKSTGGDSK